MLTERHADPRELDPLPRQEGPQLGETDLSGVSCGVRPLPDTLSFSDLESILDNPRARAGDRRNLREITAALLAPGVEAVSIVNPRAVWQEDLERLLSDPAQPTFKWQTFPSTNRERRRIPDQLLSELAQQDLLPRIGVLPREFLKEILSDTALVYGLSGSANMRVALVLEEELSINRLTGDLLTKPECAENKLKDRLRDFILHRDEPPIVLVRNFFGTPTIALPSDSLRREGWSYDSGADAMSDLWTKKLKTLALDFAAAFSSSDSVKIVRAFQSIAGHMAMYQLASPFLLEGRKPALFDPNSSTVLLGGRAAMACGDEKTRKILLHGTPVGNSLLTPEQSPKRRLSLVVRAEGDFDTMYQHMTREGGLRGRMRRFLARQFGD